MSTVTTISPYVPEQNDVITFIDESVSVKRFLAGTPGHYTCLGIDYTVTRFWQTDRTLIYIKKIPGYTITKALCFDLEEILDRIKAYVSGEKVAIANTTNHIGSGTIAAFLVSQPDFLRCYQLYKASRPLTFEEDFKRRIAALAERYRKNGPPKRRPITLRRRPNKM